MCRNIHILLISDLNRQVKCKSCGILIVCYQLCCDVISGVLELHLTNVFHLSKNVKIE